MKSEVKVAKRTVTNKHVSKEGLMKDSDKTIYDDSWLHPEIEDQEYEHELNKFIRRLGKKDVEKSELHIDLTKAGMSRGPRGPLNTSKLVKKPVQVKGKMGTFTRMQWVSTGAEDVEGHRMPKQQLPTAHHGTSHAENEGFTVGMASKPKPVDVNTREGFIDDWMRKTPWDQKIDFMEKHGIKSKPHENAQKNIMERSIALREYLNKNPHLIGAEHLPSTAGKTKETEEKVMDFLNNLTNEAFYKLVHDCGLGDGEDPRTYRENKQAANMEHARIKLSLKKYLMDNPHILKDDKWKSEEHYQGRPNADPKERTPAEKAKGDVYTLLSNTPSEKLYDLMRKYGIAEDDPRKDPSVDPKKAPMLHALYISKLKSLIEKNPEALKEINGEFKDTKKSPADELDERINDLVINRMTRDEKEFLIKKFAKHNLMQTRRRSTDPNIDYMHAVSAIKAILKASPISIDAYEEGVTKRELMETKIGNKMMGKVLRHFLKLKGVGDVTRSKENEGEWVFGANSFCSIAESDTGKPILSVVVADEDGNWLSEHEIPMEDIKKFMEGGESDKVADEPPPKKDPYKMSTGDICKELNTNFDNFFDEDVKSIMKTKLFDSISRRSTSSTDYINCNAANVIARDFPGLLYDSMKKVCASLNLPVDAAGRINVSSEGWKQLMYGHLITDKKDKNVWNYLVDHTDKQHNHPEFREGIDTWAVHQSAKKWTPEERETARIELVSKRLYLDPVKGQFTPHEYNSFVPMIVEHTRKSLSFVPFDLMSDVFMKHLDGGIQFTLDHGAEYSESNKCIRVSKQYALDRGAVQTTHPFHHVPAPVRELDSSTGKTLEYSHWPYSYTMAHEFGHAIDNYFSGGTKYTNWKPDIVKKYMPEHFRNAYMNSYTDALRSSVTSNGDPLVDTEKGYVRHKDNFMDAYEGKVYELSESDMTKDVQGRSIDPHFLIGHSRAQYGLEHWSTSVCRYAEAMNAYELHRESHNAYDFDEWVDNMSDEVTARGLRTEMYGPVEPYENISNNEYVANHRRACGYLYGLQKEHHKTMHKALHALFNRPDFYGDSGPSHLNQLESRNPGDPTFRKSDIELVLNLE